MPSESLRISISANNDAKKIVESLKTDLTCDATSISNQYDKVKKIFQIYPNNEGGLIQPALFSIVYFSMKNWE